MGAKDGGKPRGFCVVEAEEETRIEGDSNKQGGCSQGIPKGSP